MRSPAHDQEKTMRSRFLVRAGLEIGTYFAEYVAKTPKALGRGDAEVRMPRLNALESERRNKMAFRESPGLFLANVLRAALRAAGGLIALIWIVFALYLSWKLVTFGIDYLARTVFSKPWGG
jgi:hypothetical protein